MNTTLDMFGYQPPRPAFKDIRKQRDSVAEEKAILCKRLGEMCRTPPSKVRGGDIKLTREWLACCEAAKKTLGKKTASVPMLTDAIKQMERFI